MMVDEKRADAFRNESGRDEDRCDSEIYNDRENVTIAGDRGHERSRSGRS